MMQWNPYLTFDGQCEAAFKFYERCLGGKIMAMMPFGDTPHSEHVPPEARGKIMHARFEGPGIRFYASDNHDAEPMRGSAHFLLMDDREGTDRLFARLAEGGTVTTPLGIQPWGDYYGKLTDRFGVQWMIDCPAPSGLR